MGQRGFFVIRDFPPGIPGVGGPGKSDDGADGQNEKDRFPFRLLVLDADGAPSGCAARL